MYPSTVPGWGTHVGQGNLLFYDDVSRRLGVQQSWSASMMPPYLHM